MLAANLCEAEGSTSFNQNCVARRGRLWLFHVSSCCPPLGWLLQPPGTGLVPPCQGGAMSSCSYSFSRTTVFHQKDVRFQSDAGHDTRIGRKADTRHTETCTRQRGGETIDINRTRLRPSFLEAEKSSCLFCMNFIGTVSSARPTGLTRRTDWSHTQTAYQRFLRCSY